MSDSPSHPPNDVRRSRVVAHLANERTHLAYLRTSVSLIGLGIAINRFGLYLTAQPETLPRTRWITADAEHVGLIMVFFGLLLMGGALFRYHRSARAIDRHEYRPNKLMLDIITIAVLLLGLLSLFWLMQTP